MRPITQTKGLQPVASTNYGMSPNELSFGIDVGVGIGYPIIHVGKSIEVPIG